MGYIVQVVHSEGKKPTVYVDRYGSGTASLESARVFVNKLAADETRNAVAMLAGPRAIVTVEGVMG